MTEQSAPRRVPAAAPYQRWPTVHLLALLKGVVASAVGAYLMTGSAVVALAAAVLAVGLAGWLALLDTTASALKDRYRPNSPSSGELAI